MKKLITYTLKDLILDKKKLENLRSPLLGDEKEGYTYFFDEEGHLIGDPIANDFGQDAVAVGTSCYLTGNISISTFSTAYMDDDNYRKQTTGLAIQGGDVGLFKFFASNCNVEWAAYLNFSGDANGSIIIEDDAPCFLETIHKATYHENESVDLDYLQNEGFNTAIHNHPRLEAQTPSNGDNAFKASIVNDMGDGNTIGDIITNWGVYNVNTGKITRY